MSSSYRNESVLRHWIAGGLAIPVVKHTLGIPEYDLNVTVGMQGINPNAGLESINDLVLLARDGGALSYKTHRTRPRRASFGTLPVAIASSTRLWSL